ncbi:carbohydrate kinase family protein [Rhodospirillum sp. A1_3_36]|uniref:carbohydrate kinase family protein n=1 Tax=Rhodospirillum sp. A1_3_36 TaxID=3391666 RepID=UPI0039A543AC
MFLVCGEALFDVFVVEDRPDGLTLDARPGGSPFNVAIGLARLGWPVQGLMGLSADFFGDRLRAVLAREGVGTVPLPDRRAPTNLAVVRLDDRGVPTYAFGVSETADRAIRPEDLPDLPEAIQAIHMGSINTAMEPVATALLALAQRETGRRFLAYDPNVRLTVEPDQEVWRRSLASLVSLVDLLKISSEDLALLYPGRDLEDAARSWLDQGPGLVVITDGENGAQAWTAEHHLSLPCHAGPVVDTVGAGDTFQAGLLAALAEMGHLSRKGLKALDRERLAAVLDFAARAAAVTCSRRGADPPQRTELPIIP